MRGCVVLLAGVCGKVVPGNEAWVWVCGLSALYVLMNRYAV